MCIHIITLCTTNYFDCIKKNSFQIKFEEDLTIYTLFVNIERNIVNNIFACTINRRSMLKINKNKTLFVLNSCQMSCLQLNLVYPLIGN